MDPSLFVAVMIVAISAGWCLVSFAVARLGPWSRLAQRYPTLDCAVGRRYRIVSLQSGWLTYNNCLCAVASETHLTLKTWLPFRLFHPPFTLPRTAVTNVHRRKLMFWSSVSFRIDNFDLKLYGSVAGAEFWNEVEPSEKAVPLSQSDESRA